MSHWSSSGNVVYGGSVAPDIDQVTIVPVIKKGLPDTEAPTGPENCITSVQQYEDAVPLDLDGLHRAALERNPDAAEIPSWRSICAVIVGSHLH
jgi:hypothetical protein